MSLLFDTIFVFRGSKKKTNLCWALMALTVAYSFLTFTIAKLYILDVSCLFWSHISQTCHISQSPERSLDSFVCITQKFLPGLCALWCFSLDNPSSLLRSLTVTVPELCRSRAVSHVPSTEQTGFLAIKREVGKSGEEKNTAAALGLGRPVPVTVWLLLSHAHTHRKACSSVCYSTRLRYQRVLSVNPSLLLRGEDQR